MDGFHINERVRWFLWYFALIVGAFGKAGAVVLLLALSLCRWDSFRCVFGCLSPVHRTYLAGHELSLADVAVYVGLSGSRYAPPKVRKRGLDRPYVVTRFHTDAHGTVEPVRYTPITVLRGRSSMVTHRKTSQVMDSVSDNATSAVHSHVPFPLSLCSLLLTTPLARFDLKKNTFLIST